MTLAVGSGLTAADLYGDIADSPRPAWRAYLPGLTVVSAATLSAGFLADHYGAPLTLMALLIGLALNFLSADTRLLPGFQLCSRDLLRWAIVLVGLRITMAQVIGMGPLALLATIAVSGVTLATGVIVASRLRFLSSFGLLAGGAVAICGASAAMAIASLLGDRRVGQAQLTLVLVSVSALSAVAMVVYPLICHALAFGDLRAGFVLGASIHDVAQAIGAGYSYSIDAGGISALVKLSRVALLAPLLAVAALFFPSDSGARQGIGIPWFVLGFFLMAGLNSSIQLPPFIPAISQTLSTWMLAAAVSATAIRSPLKQVVHMGFRPFFVVLLATLMSLVMALLSATFITP